MHKASRALAAGADFALLGPSEPCCRLSAGHRHLRRAHGVGKSAIARWLSPGCGKQDCRLPSCDIRCPTAISSARRRSVCDSMADLDAARCTIEEREEYEPHIARGNVVFAGVDYAGILHWPRRMPTSSSGTAATTIFRSCSRTCRSVLVDPLRPHETTHHPGEAVARMADVVVVNKTDAASRSDVQLTERAARRQLERRRGSRGVSIQLDDRQ